MSIEKIVQFRTADGEQFDSYLEAEMHDSRRKSAMAVRVELEVFTDEHYRSGITRQEFVEALFKNREALRKILAREQGQ